MEAVLLILAFLLAIAGSFLFGWLLAGKIMGGR